jgi:Domain of unknown function (DUF1772)
VLEVLQIVAVLLVATAMALSLAHALEMPGKLRLSKEEYLAVQPIYYPGFTFGGIAEPAGIIALITLLFFVTGTRFWLVAGALALLAAAHAVYWVVTHPVNGFWLKDFELKGAARTFFKADPLRRSDGRSADWTAYRDRWEGSHVARAVLSLISLALLAAAVGW